MTHHTNQSLAAIISLIIKVSCKLYFQKSGISTVYVYRVRKSVTVQVFTNQFSASGYLKHFIYQRKKILLKIIFCLVLAFTVIQLGLELKYTCYAY